MGGGSYDHSSYDRIAATRSTQSQDQVFTQSTAKAVHADLDPRGLKVRESRDSNEHPESNAVAVLFDQTGSMGRAPEIFAKEALGRLMKTLLSKGYISDPQILFGAFGDYSDRVGVLQVGQFESDMRMDSCLTNLWLVGNGGGQRKESSELGLYFLARHTSIDCLEKRGKKGYAFIVTDEAAYPTVSKAQVKTIFDANIEGDIGLGSIIEEVQERYELFLVFLRTNAYSRQATQEIEQGWRKLLGERVLVLEDPSHISELISATIGLCEGHSATDINDRLKQAGASDAAVSATTTALATFSPPKSIARAKGTVSGSLSVSSGTKTGRI